MDNWIFELIWIHWVADFFTQSTTMATRKSKSNKWLTAHTAVYALPFLPIGFWYAVVNAILHWGVDWATSRITSSLWQREDKHWFFVMVGIDQAIHMTCLVFTYILFMGGKNGYC